jgi:hypothetical protein
VAAGTRLSFREHTGPLGIGLHKSASRTKRLFPMIKLAGILPASGRPITPLMACSRQHDDLAAGVTLLQLRASRILGQSRPESSRAAASNRSTNWFAVV